MAWEHPHFSGARWIGGPLPSLGDPPHWVGNWDRTLGLENSLSLLTFLSLFVLASLCLSISLFLSVFPLFSLSFSSVSLCLFFLVAEQLSPGPLSLRRPGKCSPSAAPGSGPYSFAWLINSGCRGPGNPAEPRAGGMGRRAQGRYNVSLGWGQRHGWPSHSWDAKPACLSTGKSLCGQSGLWEGKTRSVPTWDQFQRPSRPGSPTCLPPPLPLSPLLALLHPCWPSASFGGHTKLFLISEPPHFPLLFGAGSYDQRGGPSPPTKVATLTLYCLTRSWGLK